MGKFRKAMKRIREVLRCCIKKTYVAEQIWYGDLPLGEALGDIYNRLTTLENGTVIENNG